MNMISLPEIFDELAKIEGAYQPGEPSGPELTHASRIFLVDGPEWIDSGSTPRATPIYAPEEQAEYPFRGEGDAVDRLAWYQSYHYGFGNWGIYLLRSGIYKVANALISAGAEPSSSISLAREFLLRHEQTHFQTDLGVTSLEIASNKSFFIPTRRHLSKIKPGWHLTEEGLANSYGYRTLKKNKIFIDKFLSTSPVGYRDWRQFKNSTDLQTWSEILQDFLKSAQGHPLLSTYLSNKISLTYFKDIPVYEVYDISYGNAGSSYFMGSIPQIVETPEFEKDLRKLCKGQPSYAKKWNGVKLKLTSGNLVGVHFEAISKTKSIYTVRIDGEARAGLRHGSDWQAIAAGHHDELYRRLNRS